MIYNNGTHGLRIGERPEPVVALLAGRVPQAQVDGLAVDDHVVKVVVEDGRHVLLRKLVLRVGNEHRRLACHGRHL